MPKMSTFAFVGPSTRTSVAKDISTAFIQECKKGQEDSSNVPEEAEDPEDPKDPKNIPPPEQLDRLQLFLLCIINPFDSVHNGSPIATYYSQCPHGGGHWLR